MSDFSNRQYCTIRRVDHISTGAQRAKVHCEHWNCVRTKVRHSCGSRTNIYSAQLLIAIIISLLSVMRRNSAILCRAHTPHVHVTCRPALRIYSADCNLIIAYNVSLVAIQQQLILYRIY